MRRLILLLALLLAPSLASADFIRYYPPASSGSGTWAGGAVAAPGEGPAACANPAWSFTIDTNAGFCLLAADQPAITPNGGGIWARMLTTGFWVGHATTYDDIGLVPTNAGAGKFTGYITLADQTADHSWVMPDATGDVAVLAAAGFPARTAAQTWAARTITASAGGAVTNGDGVSGNPTVGPDLATTPQFSSGTGSASSTGSVGTWYHETDAGLVSTYSATDTLATMVTAQQTSSANLGFVIDEDSMASDSATKVPTQQSVKAYVDTEIAGVGSSTFDPSTQISFVDEFLVGRSDPLEYTQAWASGADGWVEGVASHWGLRKLASHVTNDNSGAGLGMYPYAAATKNSWTVGDWSLDFLVQMGATGDLTDSVILVGLIDSPAVLGTAGYGVFIRRDTDLSHAAFVATICDNGGDGCNLTGDGANANAQTSTITPTATNWYRFRIRRAASGVGGNPTIYMRVNDETEMTWCSSGCGETLANLPTGNMTPWVEYGTRTTTEVKTGYLDYLAFTVNGLTRY